MSRLMGKPTICIGENKDTDIYREADQRLCFRYSDSTIPLLPKSEISSFWLFSVTVQVDLCPTRSETTLLVFPQGGSYGKNLSKIFFSGTSGPISRKLGLKHRWLKYYNVYINHDPVMTLTQFMARSTWVANAFEWE